MAPPSICTQIVIDSTNKWIPLIIAPGGIPVDRTTSIPEAIYEDIYEVTDAIQVAVRAVGGGLIVPNFWCDVLGVQCPTGGDMVGKIKFDFTADLGAGDTVEMDWLNNNPHGSAFNDDHIGTICGVDDTADYGPIGTPWVFYTDWQHQHGWYAERAVKSYGPFWIDHVGSELRQVLDKSYAESLNIGHEGIIEMEIEAIPAWHMYWYAATGTNTNRALIANTVWIAMTNGEQFRWREDQSVEATYNEVWLLSPRKLTGKVVRYSTDYAGYGLRMRMSTGNI